jgi:hypothetical protein
VVYPVFLACVAIKVTQDFRGPVDVQASPHRDFRASRAIREEPAFRDSRE